MFYKTLLRVIVVCFCLTVLAASFVIAQEDEFDFNGYFKNEMVFLQKRSGGNLIPGEICKLRLRFDYAPRPGFVLHLEPQYQYLFSQDTLPVDQSGLDRLEFDRAYLRFSFDQVDTIAGRQRIAWGTGYIWNPTDVFNPFSLTLAEEERAGIDAVRFEIAIDTLSNVDIIFLTDKPFDEASKATRIKTNFSGFDLSASYIIGGNNQKDMVGFDAAGELLGLGVRSELGCFMPPYSQTYYKYVVGGNYTFENGWMIDTEYFHNGIGHKDPAQYDWASYGTDDVYQLAVDYGYLGFSKIINELSSVRFGYIANLDDGSYIIYPSYSYNLFQNLDMDLLALIEGGREGTEYHPTDAQDSTGFLGSSIYFVKFRFSF